MTLLAMMVVLLFGLFSIITTIVLTLKDCNKIVEKKLPNVKSIIILKRMDFVNEEMWPEFTNLEEGNEYNFDLILASLGYRNIVKIALISTTIRSIWVVNVPIELNSTQKICSLRHDSEKNILEVVISKDWGSVVFITLIFIFIEIAFFMMFSSL